MTCNNANVPDGLLILLYAGVAVVAALGGEAVVVAWLLLRRRVSLGWLPALGAALAVGVFCVWLLTDIAALRAGLEAEADGGKSGGLWVFGHAQGLGRCVAV